MKKLFLLAIMVAATHGLFAQNITLKHDTVFLKKAPYAMFKKDQPQPVQYSVCALNGKELIDIHDSRIVVKGQQTYVVTFLNDRRQAMIIKDKDFPRSFIKEMVHDHLISKGASVSRLPELRFINTHPMPDGYTDVAKIVNY